ncbi:unnamed protein product [Amoebophrya sp. A120]|nr:unnamed protein product [Amoebophrya sp. A120]|eukprot:GSA120T00011116001.1
MQNQTQMKTMEAFPGGTNFSVGETVRVRVSEQEQRRATISFLDDDTVDLLLDASLSPEQQQYSLRQSTTQQEDDKTLHSTPTRVNIDGDGPSDELCNIPVSKLTPLLGFERELLEMRDPKIRRIEQSCEDEPEDQNYLNKRWDLAFFRKLVIGAAMGGGGGATSSSSSRESWSTQHVLAAASRIKEDGNLLFKRQDYTAAFEHYTIGIDGMKVLQVSPVEDQSSNFIPSCILVQDPTDPGSLCLASRSAARSNKGEKNKGIIVVDRTTTGALYLNRGRCLEKLGKFLEAAQDFTVVIGLYSDLVLSSTTSSQGSCAAGTNSSEDPPPAASNVLDFEVTVSPSDAREKVSKAYFLRAKTKLARKKFDHAQRDVQSGKELLLMDGRPDLEFRKLEREIVIARKSFVQGNKSIAREIAKWADSALDDLNANGGGASGSSEDVIA